MVGYFALVVAVSGGTGHFDELVADFADAVVARSVTVGSAQIDFQAAVGAGNHGQFRQEEMLTKGRFVNVVKISPRRIGAPIRAQRQASAPTSLHG